MPIAAFGLVPGISKRPERELANMVSFLPGGKMVANASPVDKQTSGAC